MFRKTLALVLSAIMLLSALPFGVFAEGSDKHEAPSALKAEKTENAVLSEKAAPVLSDVKAEDESDTTGDCTWTLDGTCLIISGDGEMGDYGAEYIDGEYRTNAPWGNSMTAVVIENGVTSIESTAIQCVLIRL